MAIRMQQRRGTSEQWTAANPILAPGEIGWESETNKFKIGDGVNQWDDLDYFLSEADLEGSIDDFIPLTQKGVANGVATLDATGNVPAEQLGNAPAPDLTGYATESFVTTAVSNLVDSAPGTLDTLNELAAALADDPSFATTITNQIAGKQDVVTGVSSTEIGYLDGVTSAIQTQLNNKAASSHTHTISDVTNLQTSLNDKAASDHTHTLNDLSDVTISSAANNQVLKFNGTAWINAAAGGGILASETPPTDTAAYPLWYNTTEGRAYIYYDSFWVELTPSIAGPAGPTGPTGAQGGSGFSNEAVSSNITLAASKRYFVDTSAARTLTLPSSPTLGDEMQIFDASGTAGTNNITVQNNSNKINGTLDSALLDVNGVAAVFVWTGSTYGWRMG